MHVYHFLLTSALAASASAWNTIVLPPCVDEFKPFVSSGCYQDKGHTTLTFNPRLPREDMTVAKCIASCKGNGFRYAGLEYYGECYCGSSVNGPQIGDENCSYACNGDKNDKCGGSDAISVWQDPTFTKGPDDVSVESYKSLGCYSDDLKQGRALSQQLKVESVTAAKCINACRANGFPFAGTQYGSECWCGAVLANGTAPVDNAECNINCAGDASAKCGGSKRLDLFVAEELESLEPCGSTTTKPPPPGTTSTQSPPPGTTSTQSPPPGTTSTKVPPPGTTSTKVPPPGTTSTKVPPPGTTTTKVPPPGTTSTSVPPPRTTSTKVPPTTTKTWQTKTKTTTLPPPTNTCPPEPICKQVGKPVNGIELPFINCIKWNKIEKFACLAACKIQFAKCLTGGHGLGKDANGRVGSQVGENIDLNDIDLSQFGMSENDNIVQARTFGPILNAIKCKWQLLECLKVNAFDFTKHCKDCKKPGHGY